MEANSNIQISELEKLSEQELESIISSTQNNDARLILARALIDGTNNTIPMNETKGLNILNEAVN